VSGSVTGTYGWKAGFLAGGIGMVISLLLQMGLADRWLGNIGIEPAAKKHAVATQSR
jgi:POT family proton-dependent oligopeptide transporter